ncbi:MAG: hypothetical protein H7A32_01490 [Deltaproteobacteria bacterium]|nr:hypothetical protein [Deltaproteobacteria bacterium]
MSESNSSSLLQGVSQNSYSVDSSLGPVQQDFTSDEKTDFSPAPPIFNEQTSPQSKLQKLEKNNKAEPNTWDNLKAKADSAHGYIEGLTFPVTELRNQAADALGIKNPLIESPHYRAGYQSGKNDLKEGLTYASGFGDGINPMTPIGDAVAETFNVQRVHVGSESTYWKGRIDGSAAGVLVDGALMAGGGTMIDGSAACEVGTAGACTIVAGPGLAAGATLAGAGALSMTGHLTTYVDAQKQYLQSRAKESVGKNKPDSSKIGELDVPKKIRDQMQARGWTKKSIENTKDNPFAIREALNKANNNKATAYFNKDGSYIVVDQVDKSIIQVSNRLDPEWIPDSSILNAYIPK